MERGCQLDPQTKAWLDHVIIPALVEVFVRERLAIRAQASDTDTCPKEETQSDSLRRVRPLQQRPTKPSIHR